MIFSGDLKPGERIYEAEVARQFQVSRSPVREAVRSLEREGLLIVDEKSRISVYNPTLQDVEDLYACRQALESLAARLTARLASDEDLTKIEQMLSQHKNALKENRPKSELMELNVKFHDQLWQASRNRRLQKQIDDIRSITYFYRTMSVNDSERYWTIYNEHQAIFNEIKERRYEEASRLMFAHIGHDLDYIKSQLSKKE